MIETGISEARETRYVAETRSNQQSGEQEQGARVGSIALLLAVALIGLGLTIVGVFAIFNKLEAETLVVAGVALIVLAAFGNHLDSLKFGKFELVLRRVADEAAARGDLQTAKVLQTAANSVSQRLATASKSYATLRSTLPAGRERTEQMEKILAEARRDARAMDIDADEVLRLLWTGSEGARVWALGVLQTRPDLATTRAVLEAVERPDQMFDQYHALVLADLFVQLPTCRTWARERIQRAVRAYLESEALGQDEDCLRVAKDVIRHAQNSPSQLHTV